MATVHTLMVEDDRAVARGLAQRLRDEELCRPNVTLAARDEELELELGADDYVVRLHNLRELISRICAVPRRA